MTLALKGENVCLAVLDMDFFKSQNELFGHRHGDFVLQKIAQNIDETLKNNPEMTAYRYGGEEFAIIFRDTEKKQALQKLAEIRKILIRIKIFKSLRLNILKNANLKLKNSQNLWKEGLKTEKF
ncbi:MAG: diguanylate cyclase [Desulfobacterales bacterium]|nr:diguanylate cyclase [Desulfobacterales bacterium]